MGVPFVDARSDVPWVHAGREVTGRTDDGIAIAARKRWWGHLWSVETVSASPVPEPLTLFVSRRGPDRGYWRDIPIGDREFDRLHFVYCDVPALLPIVVGAATRAAIHDRSEFRGDDLDLDLSEGVVRVRGRNDGRDTTAIERHLVVHRGLVADVVTFAARWRAIADAFDGETEVTWPPLATLHTPVGAVGMRLRWRVPTRDRDGRTTATSLRTELSAQLVYDGPRWYVRAATDDERETHVVGDRRLVVRGHVEAAVLARAARLITEADIDTVAIGAQASVTLRGVADPPRIGRALELLASLTTTRATGPYR